MTEYEMLDIILTIIGIIVSLLLNTTLDHC